MEKDIGQVRLIKNTESELRIMNKERMDEGEKDGRSKHFKTKIVIFTRLFEQMKDAERKWNDLMIKRFELKSPYMGKNSVLAP